jgi:hypothetical protein
MYEDKICFFCSMLWVPYLVTASKSFLWPVQHLTRPPLKAKKILVEGLLSMLQFLGGLAFEQ